MAASNNSVDKAIGLLRLVAHSHRPLRFTDLQAASGIPKGTLHSLLASLEKADFLTRTSNGYEIGVGAFEVGTAVRGPASLRAAASKLLDELFAEHGEACHFGMLHQGDVVYLDCRNSMHELRFISRIGSRKPPTRQRWARPCSACTRTSRSRRYTRPAFRYLPRRP